MADEQLLLDLIAANRQGILAGITRAGYPHLTNVLYVWDPVKRIARVSTTADRVKGRILRRDPHAALHVPGATSGPSPSAKATQSSPRALRRPATRHPANCWRSTHRSTARSKTRTRSTAR
jgi:hypothetical protein